VRSGDIGDEAAQSADDAELPLDLAAVRADDDLIEALSAGLVPPPSGPRDPSDVEGELVALLAGWVADVRPESLLHPPGSQPVAVKLITSSAAERAEDDEPLAAVGSPAPARSLLEYEDAEPVTITRRRPHGTRGYLLRAAAGLVAIALIGSGVVVRSYDAHPGDSLWVVAKVVFPAKSRSVEAATAVSTALNTARVALESGRIGDARAAFQTVQDQLAAVDDAEGRVELAHQRDYLTAQLGGEVVAVEQAAAPTAGAPLATGQAGATIPSSPAVTPGAIQALLTPTASPSVLAAPSGDSTATASGAGSAPAVGGSSAPAVVAAPPDDPTVSAPPAVSKPAPSDTVSGSSAGSPPAASAPPVVPATEPPVSTPSPEPPAPTSAPADPPVQSTPDPPVGNGGSGGGSDNSDNSANSVANASADPPSGGSSSGSVESSDSSGGSAANKTSDNSSDNSSSSSSGGGSDNGQKSSKSGGGSGSSSGGDGSGGGTTAAAGAEISVDGLAGSTLGAVTGVVASTAGA
jgi:uncharacterized membrane protein YgcG